MTLEGGEGAGKSSQAALLADALRLAGLTVVRTREPGGARGAEEIRRLFVEGTPERWDAETEALLVVAARRNHLVETIWPALNRGEWVVSDRFADSTLAYQGYGRGLPQEALRSLHEFIAGDFKPDLTIILDLPVNTGLSRAAHRHDQETRFESMDREFHERLRQGFLDIARQEPKRCLVIDAGGTVDAVHQAIRAAVHARLGVAL
ncbi:MAG TPA: dTMP kinase [Stellaceae bacterium]|nr:dTMP kinase [Stellaceae bacterium]